MTTGPAVVASAVHVPGILADVSIHVPAGSTTAIIGPSGAGKTTLLRIIAGFLAPTAGSLRIDDHEAATDGAVLIPPADRSLGYLPQDLGLWDHLPARAHLRLVLDAAHPSLARGTRRDEVNAMLERLGLADVAARRAGLLSGGERRRLALGRALITGPRLLLLDEPFSGVDYELRDRLLQLLSTTEPERQPTVIAVSHVREETLELAQQVVVLTDGRVVESGDVETVRATPQSTFAQRFFQTEDRP